MKSLAIAIMLVGSVSLAHSGKHKKSHHGHGAHVHGHGTLAIAFDGTKGSLEFKAPAESIVGFEHAPKSEADQKTVADIKAKFESELAQMIQLDPSSACSFSKEKLDLVSEKNGKHADFVAHFQINCQSPLVGKTLTVDFSKFPKLQKTEITVLAGELQKTATAQKQAVKIELK